MHAAYDPSYDTGLGKAEIDKQIDFDADETISHRIDSESNTLTAMLC